MPINPVWPKPYKWLVDPRLVHPSQRWVWHTKPRFIVPAWEDARPGTAQRYRRLRYGRGSQHDWRLNTSASTIRTRFGPAISIPTTDGAELEGANSLPIVFFNNESYTIALLLKGRSGGASTKHLYRSGASSTDDHILWLASGVTPNLRHDSNTGTVTITSSVSITNDTAWHTIVTTWRKKLAPRELIDRIARESELHLIRWPAPSRPGLALDIAANEAHHLGAVPLGGAEQAADLVAVAVEQEGGR